tara:strand:+ start:685 stop:1206 length:522 start_codon:yes stop_codon:yes gene_type:complete
MATRNMIMVVDRRHAEQSDLGFADSPEAFADNSRVNMYMHHDGYPEWQAVQIANWLQAGNDTMDGARLAAKLVHDMYYDSCYLYNNWINIDHHYTYIIWTGKKDIWVSCWDNYSNRNVFVLPPHKIITKYITDMEYTDFTNGETRWQQQQKRNAMWDKKEQQKINAMWDKKVD